MGGYLGVAVALRVAERFGQEPAAFLLRWSRMDVADRLALAAFEKVRIEEEGIRHHG